VFYPEVLGLGTPTYDLPDAGWIEWANGNEANISITPVAGAFTPSHHTTIVFNVDDCHAGAVSIAMTQ
jgi:hypothetical protein